MVEQMAWVPESVYRRSVGRLRGWVIALAVVVLLGLLVLGAVLLRGMFATTSFPVVASSPRECRLAGDVQDPKLYVAVDATMIVSGSLRRASSVGPTGLQVEAVGVVPSVGRLDMLDDAEFERLVEAAEENAVFLEDEEHGVVVAIIDTDGESSGYLRGLRMLWVLGEPVHEQDLPLGIEFTPAGCTVTTAG